MKEIQVHIGKRYKTAKATLAGVLIGDGTGGAVKSVNGKTGDVVLTPEDVGALSDEIKVPSKVSELVNDSGFMSDKEVVAKINEALGNVAGGLKFEVVESTDEIDTTIAGNNNIIYLVKSKTSSEHGIQYYDEYMVMNGKPEKLGGTQVNLEPYYTGMKVDNLIYNVQKSIPTKMSQLYNDAGYVKAKDIETGEATWDSLKGNILETIETPITWDGNTEGRETHPKWTSFYKVSDVVLTAEDAVGLRYDTTYNANSYVIPEVGTNWLINTVDYGTYWMAAGDMICVYDESIGCSKGIYFLKSVADDGTNKEYWTNELILEADKIKPELLPDYVHEIPHFDLTEIGLPAIPIGQGFVRVEIDTTEIMKAFERGSVKLSALASVGDELMNFTIQGTVAFAVNSYQCGAICYFQGAFVIVSVVVHDGGIEAIADVVHTMSTTN